jgi:hypothetical protein
VILHAGELFIALCGSGIEREERTFLVRGLRARTMMVQTADW